MKKLVMTGAVLVCAASVALAQTVTSANMVGYSKSDNIDYQILGTQFDAGATTPSAVFGSQLPYDSTIFAFVGGAYLPSTYTKGFFGAPDSWTDDTLFLGQGAAYWVSVPEGTHTSIISGEVDLADAVTNSVVTGYQLLSYPYPVARAVSQLGFVPQYDDVVFKFSGGSYLPSTWTKGFFGAPDFWSDDFTIEVGEGFWYSSGVDATWITTRPFTP